MKLSVSWLREYVETTLSDDELAARLTMAGLEVEETTPGEEGPVFHTKTTPNRGDWLSVVGVAREAAAYLDLPLKWHPQPLPDENPDITRWVGVRVEDPTLCPRYAGKLIRNVQFLPTPGWMQRRLLDAGMRPLNVVVDITNYVMLELGQPLHAFDYDTLPEGQIIVRAARDGETLTTLDGSERVLTSDMLAICDKDKPIVVAGVMGGAETEISGTTRHIFLESAQFDPGSVRRTSKALGLSTEASYRYERFVDPELAPLALERACELLADHAGGEVVLGRIDIYPQPRTATEIALRPARVNAILGTGLTEETIIHSLRRLGLSVDAAGEPLQVTVPTFRPDLIQEIDLVEEVGRMVGYDTLPETLPACARTGRARRTGGPFRSPPAGSFNRAGPLGSADPFFRPRLRPLTIRAKRSSASRSGRRCLPNFRGCANRSFPTCSMSWRETCGSGSRKCGYLKRAKSLPKKRVDSTGKPAQSLRR